MVALIARLYVRRYVVPSAVPGKITRSAQKALGLFCFYSAAVTLAKCKKRPL